MVDPFTQSLTDHGVLAAYKTPSTANVRYAIQVALEEVLKIAQVPKNEIACVVVGTTSFINAVVEQDAYRLDKVAIIRLSKSFLREVPPFSSFPPGLRRICDGYLGYVDGGLAIDGSEEAPLDESQVLQHCQEIRNLGLPAVVVAGVFSPIDESFQQEDCVERIIKRELPHVDVVCSRKVANIGFKERENASILNASILRFARRTVRGFQSALRELGLSCPLYLTQNDGTIAECYQAADFPIRTFSSGATNSMRGAAHLGAAKKDRETPRIVVDIGGTTAMLAFLKRPDFHDRRLLT